MELILRAISENGTASAIAGLMALLVSALFYYKNQYEYFERLGLKNPPPYAPFGNLYQIISGDRMVIERKWARQFGKLYGVFNGVRPRFVIADAEVLRAICIKDFEVFPNHEASQFLNEYQRRFIFFMQDDHWKRVRALQTPTFTSGKIKRMFKLLDKCADDLLTCCDEQLEAQSSKSAIIQLKELYSLFTMDAIASCGYGLKLERAPGVTSIKSVAARNAFVQIAMRQFEINYLRVAVAFALPKWLLGPLDFRVTPKSRVDPLAKRVEQIVEQRKKQSISKQYDDYLQILLDAKMDDKLELDDMDTKENHHAGLTHDSLRADQKRMIEQTNGEAKTVTYSKARLSQEEVLASAIFLLTVGLETTATLLTNTTYALAFNSEIQEKLYNEIASIAQQVDGRFVFDYEALTSCQYLDAVISETLRFLSPVLALDRESKADYYVEKYDLTIPAGSKLNLAYYAIMNDPDYWPQPELFDPERFMPGQKERIVPGSYCPFGLGPRHCLGMRFSLTEAKLALAKVLMKYKFLPVEGLKFPPVAKRGLGLNGLVDPRVRFELRK